MSDLPIITVTSLHDSFANAESVPVLPLFFLCNLPDPCMRNHSEFGWSPQKSSVCGHQGPCPFDAMLVEGVDRCTCGAGGPLGHEQGCGLELVGKFTVTDMHHADECVRDYWLLGHRKGYCHPDAEPDKWHLTFKEADHA